MAEDPSDDDWRDPSRAVQMLSTEHWSLLSARSLAWNEAFSRSALYLTVLSASVVALALVAQATEFDERFVLVAVVLMSVVFFIGVTTVVRLQQSAIEDVVWVAGMNRIRHAYVELEPRLAHYLITSTADDERGLLTSVGVPPDNSAMFGHLFVTTPGMISVVNSVVAGVTLGVLVAAGGAPPWAAVVVGLLAFVGVALLMAWSGLRAFDSLRRRHVPLFPSPEG